MTSPVPPTDAPTVEEIDRIRDVPSPVLRNLQITDAYHRLAVALGRRTGTCANWCTFATWASRQAGQTIRGEDGFEALQARLRLSFLWLHPVQSLWRRLLAAGLDDPAAPFGRLVHAVHGPLDPLERASDAVARGNRKVFEEIGREFARFLEACAHDDPDGSRVAAFLDSLRDGDPPDGQQLLRQAFTRYHQALTEPDPTRRAQSMYLANLLIGWHEQTRLQPEIQEALEAPAIELRALGERMLGVFRASPARWHPAIRIPAALTLGTLGWPLALAARALMREVITACLMTLHVPTDKVIRLGRNLDAPFPESLRTLADEDAVWLSRIRCDAVGIHDCAAQDWASLEERLHFIAHLFRAYHEDAGLAAPPFTPAQLAALGAGRLPEGTL